MATSASMVMLFASLGALRLFGQGLITHTAMTSISRYFVADRGKALSITSLGHAAGEALLPLTAVALMAIIGWRYTFVLYGTILGALVSLAVSFHVRDMKTFRRPISGQSAFAGPASGKFIGRMPAFWAFMPSMIAVPFALTALIFHQGLLASGFDLPLTAFAAGFAFFALMQVPGSMLGGRWTDQTSARFLMSWHVVPVMAGIAVLALAGAVWSAIVFLALAGFSSGWSNVLRSAIIAEMVPAESIGGARSIATSAMVLSTAVGPALFGFLYAQGFDAAGLLWAAFLALGVAGVTSWLANRLFPARKREGDSSLCAEKKYRNEEG
jgi:MFS family permease